MEVTVDYLGQVRVITGRKNEVVDVAAGATIKDLLQKLSTRYGDAFDQEVFQEDRQNPRDDMVVAINGTAIERILARKGLIPRPAPSAAVEAPVAGVPGVGD